MVDFVVDNSVAIAWIYPAQASDYTERLLELAGSAVLHTAFIWPAEFANAASVLVRRGTLSESLGEEMLRMVDTLRLTPDKTPPDTASLYQLSRRHALSAYDAAYLELALRLKLPLATRDTSLEKAAQSLSLFME